MADPAPTAPPTLADRFLGWRYRLLANPIFQRLATAFPLTRPIARRRASALFDLCAGFVYSQVLLACVRLRLLAILAEGPQAAEELASRLALPLEAARRLLEAAVALDLAGRRSHGRYGLGKLGASLVATPGLAEMVEHHAVLYADLADPVALLRGERGATALGRFWSYSGADRPADLTPPAVSDYSALMALTQSSFVAEDVIASYPFGKHRRLMDVGGGEGAFLSAVAKRFPALRLTLFDLPAVAERACARFAAEGIADAAQAIGGDFKSSPLPQGADIVTLIRVLHDHDDDAALAILRAVRQALPPKGVLLVAEPMVEPRGAARAGAAYFGLYLFAMGRGRPRRPEEVFELLATAGFEGAHVVPNRNPLLLRIIAAHAATARGMC